MITNSKIENAMNVKLDFISKELPDYPVFIKGVRRAPKRDLNLSKKEIALSLKNALRYIPSKL